MLSHAGSSGTSAPSAGSAPAMTERFVQLSTDSDRSSLVGGVGCEPAFSATVRVPADLPRAKSGSARQAEVAGALAALLHRYTQQASIALDLLAESPSTIPSRIALTMTAAGDAPVASMIVQASAGLAVADLAGVALSNIAATVIDASSEPASSFDMAARVAAAPAGYELCFIVADARDATLLAIAYNAKLLRPSTVDRLAASAVTLLGAALRDRETTIERLPLLTADEVRALTIDQDSGTAAYPRVPVVRLFEALAHAQPEAIAVRFRDERLTYGELDARSNLLAHHLIACGVGPEVPVAVCVRPSLDILVALLAIWKARGTYLPLDPTHPEALIGRMLDEARPRLVLTHSTVSALTRPERFSQLCMDTDLGFLANNPSTSPSTSPTFDDAAYLLYTSGTTGKPKGVHATQGNLAHYIHSAQQKYGFTAEDIFSSLARYTFSISLFDLISPLVCGGSVRIIDRDDVLTPERLCKVLDEVTVVHAGPSLLGSLFRYLRATPSAPRTFPKMRHASSGGDLVPPSVMEEMKQVFENAEIYVIYGCTEISCMGTTFPVRTRGPVVGETKVTRSFVGKPFPDVTVRVLDPKRDLVPFGVVGEICFAGKGIVRGYLDQPELTAQKFINIDGQRFYQTGDMGRLHEGGNLEILGRRDFQVQLRGIRIELAGIEKTVQELGLAAQCAVVAKKLDLDDVRLVAFVVGPNVPTAAAFRKALSAQLPDYMLPQHVAVLDAMPLTANGKLDRNRLQDMPWDTQLGAQAQSDDGTANETERRIAEVFSRVLGIGAIGVEDDFFDVGGHSLLAVIAMQEIESALGITIPPHILFEHATARALAAHAADAAKGDSRPILLNAKPTAHGGPSRPPLFMVSGIHLYRDLAKHMEGRYSAYGVFAGHEIGTPETATKLVSVPDLARDYIEIIRRQQPVGPYRLLGYSFGGLVAYEVAQQLRAAGEEVRFLALIDAVLPEWTSGWRFRLAQIARLWSVHPRLVLGFVWRRLREKLGSPAPEFARYKEDRKLGPLEAQRDTVNAVAAAKYLKQIRPFRGNVTLIAAGERLRNDPLKSPSCGWSPYVPSLDVHNVDTDHFRLLTDDPYVSEMAEILVGRMQRIERDTS
jgi:amino acid adenylation domain-containing protein